MPVDKKFVLRAMFQQGPIAGMVGQGGRRCLGSGDAHEDRIVNDPGMPIDQGLYRGQTAAIVPAAGVRPSNDRCDRDRSDHNQTFREYLASLTRVHRMGHRILRDTIHVRLPNGFPITGSL